VNKPVENPVEKQGNNLLITLWISTDPRPKPTQSGYPQGYPSRFRQVFNGFRRSKDINLLSLQQNVEMWKSEFTN